MKKNTFILMAMTAMFGLSSCDKELFSTENTNKTFTLFATTESGTKTALSWNDEEEHYDVVWSEDDQFTVFLFGSTDKNCVFTLTNGDAGKTSGTFMGEKLDPSKKYIAYYPVNENSTDINTWPTNQTYHGENNITGCPMISSNFQGSDKSVTFTNLGGILRLTVTNEEENEEENVSISKITVCADGLESPITLDCSNKGKGVDLTAVGTQFNIAMPSKNGNEPASYSNVSIYLTDMEDNICCKSLQSGVKLDIVRSKITNASFSVNSKDFYSSTTGSKVTFGGHEGIVVNINGKKVIVATMNVGATSVNEDGCLGSKLAFAKSYTAWSGWRLPTVGELTAFCDPGYHGVCGNTEGVESEEGKKSGAMMWDFDENGEIDLYLPLNDYEDTELGSYPCDKYWTGPADNDGKYFYFVPEIDWEGGDGNTYYPIGYDYREPYNAAAKTSKFLVRLFHDLP